MTWLDALTSCFKGEEEKVPAKGRKVKPATVKQPSMPRIPSILTVPGSPKFADDLSRSVGSNICVFTTGELRSITNHFSSSYFLGGGGFGPVYKGIIDEKLRHGALKPMTVAVKLLDLEGRQGHKEWLKEVIYLGKLNHDHVVKLVGYCCEDEQRLLVYEFMARGSLENHLFKRFSISLPWEARLKVAVGAAKGLAFLHGLEKPIIYRDFKPSNILLHHDFTAKISDFGLAVDGPEGDDSHLSTRVMGTHGYAAPEYLLSGHVTKKCDVYSYGVVLLELLTGLRAMDKKRPSRQQNLVEWARPYLRDGRRVGKIMDLNLNGQYSIKAAHQTAALAYECLSPNPKKRPRMNTVVERLEPLQALSDQAMSHFVYAAPPANGKKSVEKDGKEAGNSTKISSLVGDKENGHLAANTRNGNHHSYRNRSPISVTVTKSRLVNADGISYKHRNSEEHNKHRETLRS